MRITYPSSATNSFQYNGLGLRTRKVDSSGTINYVCDGTTPASPVLADSNATYAPGLSERRGSTSKFLHSDALGTTRGITNSSQTATDGLLFDAFGIGVSRTGTTPTPFGFAGAAEYQTDADSGLMLLGHRYYDPSVGRFVTEDPIHDRDNWYSYCYNQPLRNVDANGLQGVIVVGNPWIGLVGGDAAALPRPNIGSWIDGIKPIAEAAKPIITVGNKAAGFWGNSIEGLVEALRPILPDSFPPFHIDQVVRPNPPKGGGANDKPSWVVGRPQIGERPAEFAKRQLDQKYGPGEWPKGPGTEHNQIEKWASRRFMNPPIIGR